MWNGILFVSGLQKVKVYVCPRTIIKILKIKCYKPNGDKMKSVKKFNLK